MNTYFGLVFVFSREHNRFTMKGGIAKYLVKAYVSLLIIYATRLIMESVTRQYMEYELLDDTELRRWAGQAKTKRRVKSNRKLVHLIERSVKRARTLTD